MNKKNSYFGLFRINAEMVLGIYTLKMYLIYAKFLESESQSSWNRKLVSKIINKNFL